MKDIVENRRRITLGRKFRIARPALQENGLLWCLLFFTYYVASTLERHGLRKTRSLTYWVDGETVHRIDSDDLITVFATP